jgi:hypothetical protein
MALRLLHLADIHFGAVLDERFIASKLPEIEATAKMMLQAVGCLPFGARTLRKTNTTCTMSCARSLSTRLPRAGPLEVDTKRCRGGGG